MTLNKRGHAFTLIELVVVLFVLTLVTSLVMQRYGGQSQQKKALEIGKRFVTVLDFASEQALLQQLAFALIVQPTSYAFARYDPINEQWRLIEEDKVLAAMQLSVGFSLQLMTAEEVQMAAYSSAEQPSVFIDATGSLQAFTLQILYEQHPLVVVQADQAAVVSLSKVKQ